MLISSATFSRNHFSPRAAGCHRQPIFCRQIPAIRAIYIFDKITELPLGKNPVSAGKGQPYKTIHEEAKRRYR